MGCHSGQPIGLIGHGILEQPLAVIPDLAVDIGEATIFTQRPAASAGEPVHCESWPSSNLSSVERHDGQPVLYIDIIRRLF